MNYIKDINLKENNLYNMIIEIPKGTRNKYELVEGTFDKVEKVRKVKKTYPFYYGCFPQTLAKDGDALDAILLSKKKRHILDVIPVKTLGMIKTVDAGDLDIKVICIPEDESVKDIEKAVNKVFKFLSKYKGRKADMHIDKKFYENAEVEIEKTHKVFLGR